MHIMYRDDPVYPDQLLNIPDPPVFLYWRGSTDCLSRRYLTFVGARHASVTAIRATEEITSELSRTGISVVSGIAQGIDQAAHRGCLAGGSPAIAVLPGGLDMWPSGSAALRKKILDGGGVLLSEFHPGDPALDWHYPVRNRILSGLSRGTVMMECQIRSGSMNTVKHALDQGRDVFAWPGIPGSEESQGAHQLLREGAIYFTSAGDLLEDMGWDSLPTAGQDSSRPISQLPPEQRSICAALRQRDHTLDELVFATGLDTPVLSSALTMLQLMGYISSLPGKVYHLI